MLAVLIFAAASAAASSAAARVESAAQAKVRVLSAVTASRDGWNKNSSPHKKVILVKELDGRLTLVRVVDNE